MFERILIANRGEIAVRILRACRTLGIGAVVAYSEADRDSLAAQLADEAICIGPADSRRSYLSAAAVISAAIVTGCDAIHPGYGFLSEDAGFAEAVAAHGLTFIGPSAEVLERFASKEGTRALLAQPRPPDRPGLRRASCATTSTPSPRRRGSATRSCSSRRPAAAARGCASFAAPANSRPRSGSAGRRRRPPSATTRSTSRSGWRTTATWRSRSRSTATAAGSTSASATAPSSAATRRCSRKARRRPSRRSRRAELAERAIRAVVAAGYENLGTLEFLVDGDGRFYFIEINCRVQVEHAGHGDADRDRPDRDPDPDRRRRAARDRPERRRHPRPRDRVPDQRRGSGPRVPAAGRHRRGASTRPAARGSGWTPTSTPATRSRPTTIPCSAS